MKKFLIVILFLITTPALALDVFGPAWVVDDNIAKPGASITSIDFDNISTSNLSASIPELDPIALPIIDNHTGSDPHRGIFDEISTTGTVHVGGELHTHDNFSFDKHIIYAGISTIFTVLIRNFKLLR